MREVADASGVSIATVSHVLRGTKRVSPAVAARVKDAAERLGYVLNSQASALRTGRSGLLGVVLPDLRNPFYAATLNAVERAARAAGFLAVFHDTENSPELEAEAMERLASLRVDGIVWVPVQDPRAARADAHRSRLVSDIPAPLNLPGLPIVTLDRPVADRDAVFADHVRGGALVAAHLRQIGASRVALLHGSAALASARARRRGFTAEFDPVVPVWEAQSGFDFEIPADVVRRLQAGGFDAVVCANDSVAVGVLRILRRAGARVPEDVAVIGFDDVPLAALVEPGLTTVRQPLAGAAGAAIRLLQERASDLSRPARQVVLPVELVVRGSSVLSASGGRLPVEGALMGAWG